MRNSTRTKFTYIFMTKFEVNVEEKSIEAKSRLMYSREKYLPLEWKSTFWICPPNRIAIVHFEP